MTRTKPVRVALPRPKGTRATSRVALTVTMHPRDLERLKARAAAVSMSLTAYVGALLESDAEDVPGAQRPRSLFSLAELASPAELIGAGVHRDVPVTLEQAIELGARCEQGHPICDIVTLGSLYFCNDCARIRTACAGRPDAGEG